MLACSGGGESKDTRPAGGATAAVQGSPSARPAGTDTGSAVGSAATRSRPKVLIIGTSLTAGLGIDPNQAYPADLQHLADSSGYSVEIVNGGLSGETSAGALRRVDWLLNDQPAIVMIETGANDGLRGLDPDSTAANIKATIGKIRGRYPATTILLAQMEAPPNFGPAYTRKFHDLYPRTAKEQGVILLPFLLDSVAGVSRLNQADGIHPTVEGARIVARNVWRTLGPQVARLDR